MGARNVAGDGEAQARTAFVLIARFVEAQKGTEYVFTMLGRDAWTIVIDMNAYESPVASQGYVDTRSIPLRI